MGTLDRYITRLFVTNIVLIFVFLCMVIVAVDFSLNFDEFTRGAQQILESRGESAGFLGKGGLAFMLVLDLWWPRLFLLFNFLLGPVLIGALGFTCAYLVKHRELVAMLAGGVSLQRIARPILIVTVGMAGLLVVNREVVLPRLAPLLTREKVDAGKRSLGSTFDVTVDAQGRLVYSSKADLDTSTISGLYVYERDAQGLMTRRISADTAKWDGSKWVLENGLAYSRRPVADAGAGTRVLPDPVASIATDVDPTALKLRRYEGMASNLSTAQVGGLIERFARMEQTPAVERRIVALERNRWGRVSTAASIILTVVVCLPFFLKKEPANMLQQSLLAAPMALGAFAGTLIGTTASIPGLPAQVGVFLPVVMLVPAAILAAGSLRS